MYSRISPNVDDAWEFGGAHDNAIPSQYSPSDPNVPGGNHVLYLTPKEDGIKFHMIKLHAGHTADCKMLPWFAMNSVNMDNRTVFANFTNVTAALGNVEL